MAINSTLLTLLQELMATWDDSIDTSEGSSFYEAVGRPLLERIGESPLDVDLEAFFVDRLQTEIENIDVSELSGLRDLLIRAELPMFLPFRREILAAKITGSINNFEQMTREEFDERLANYFTSLRSGATAQTVVRNYYTAPRSAIVTPSNEYSTPRGVRFFPVVVQSITAEQMSFQQSQGLYYHDVTVESEGTGPAYNVGAREINQVKGVPGVVQVANLNDVTDSIAEETKEDGLARAQGALTLRTLTGELGIDFVIRENFPSIQQLTTIGYGDPEMLRDFIEGPVSIGGIPGGPFGTSTLDVDAAGVHVGSLVDTYAYQRDINTDQLDIDKVTDKGWRLHAASRGYTAPAGGSIFFDDAGSFDLRGIDPGGIEGSPAWEQDWLLLGEDEYIISTAVSGTLTLLEADGVTPAVLEGGLTARTYEIVRRDPSRLSIPLYDLVAAGGGVPLLSEGGTPLAPVPGALDLDPLVDGAGDNVEKTENISPENISLPLLRISSVEELDPLTLDATGVSLALADLEAVKVLSGFAEDAESTGKVRLYFKDPVNLYLLPDAWKTAWPASVNVATRLEAEGGRTYYRNTATLDLSAYTASGAATETEIQIETGSAPNATALAALLTAGDRIFVDDTDNSQKTVVQVISAAVAGTAVNVSIRETLAASFSAVPCYHAEGTTQALMSTQGTDETGLYYYDNVYDFEVNSAVSTAPEVGDYFAAWTLETAEGYRTRTSYSNLTFSTREAPYLQLSNWVGDDTNLADESSDFAYRVTYEFADTLAAIQTFVEDPDNRVPSQDLLVRHYRPSYVFSPDLVVRGIAAADALAEISEFIKDKDPEEQLQASDLVDKLYAAGTTKVQSPYTLVGLAHSESRTWKATISTDSLDTVRVQHFLPDEDAMSITEEAGS